MKGNKHVSYKLSYLFPFSFPFHSKTPCHYANYWRTHKLLSLPTELFFYTLLQTSFQTMFCLVACGVEVEVHITLCYSPQLFAITMAIPHARAMTAQGIATWSYYRRQGKCPGKEKTPKIYLPLKIFVAKIILIKSRRWFIVSK